MITIASGPHPLQALSGTWGTEAREVRRSLDQMIVTIWAPTPDLRKAITRVLDVKLASILRLNMPDGTRASIKYVRSTLQDTQQKAVIFWRDLVYDVAYSVIETRDAPEIIVVQQNTTGNQIGDPAPVVETIYGGP